MSINVADVIFDGKLRAKRDFDLDKPYDFLSEVHWNKFRWNIFPGKINLIYQKNFKN